MKGITLVELLMSLIIVSIVMASIYNILQHSLKAHSYVEAQAEVSQNARMAIERFSKEVRQAGSFEYGREYDIEFSIDKNGDGDNEDDGERIKYAWDQVEGGNLERTDKPAGANPSWRDYDVIANYVKNFVITYRNGNNNVLDAFPLSGDDRDLIQLISVDIELEKERKGGDDLYTVELRSTMHPRNR